jgi:hypothetical protein
VERFITAIERVGGHVVLTATRRPRERAYLMHYSWLVSRGLNPASVPAYDGIPVAIDWVAGGKVGAQEMVDGYALRYQPSLTSRHIEGQAIDATFSWDGSLLVMNGAGVRVVLVSTANGGSEHANTRLHDVGRSYGVVKLISDPPHWSTDGR